MRCLLGGDGHQHEWAVRMEWSADAFGLGLRHHDHPRAFGEHVCLIGPVAGGNDDVDASAWPQQAADVGVRQPERHGRETWWNAAPIVQAYIGDGFTGPCGSDEPPVHGLP